MRAAEAAQLREPFKPNEIGKLPRIICPACRGAVTKNCPEHAKQKCPDCGNWMTTAHMHLDYVGHAEVTDRLLQVDPAWTWEPLATNHDGIPFLDNHGGMWIRLTVAGVSRLGYGHPDGKKTADGVKEAIGDALRNAAMRFGVGLDLWGAKFEAEAKAEHPYTESPTEQAQPTAAESKDSPSTASSPPPPPMVSQAQHKHMHALWRDLGYDGDTNRDLRLQIMAKILGVPSLGSSKDLTKAHADLVIERLKERQAQMRQQVTQQQQGEPQ